MRLMSINVGRIKDNVLCLKIKKLWRSITLLMSGLTFTDLDYVMMGLQNYVNLEFWIHLSLFFIETMGCHWTQDIIMVCMFI